ncbi:plasmid stabilization protein [Ventosimonas gracilis]|uniref:Plasmid stabilization protein n=1 Tax=Ventosimonas gracilis TaxID=1680762 RepID=A0A139ST79_9GAMM|nr:type II toxin-antitoxin system RelE/ParE family toxin [Ventosimonas gracilis]KXU37776.1 plasmid stabilization protein [Ventosimonas gracilis]
MACVRIQEAAALRLDEIYRYTRKQWGEAKAADYLDELFAAFDAIVTHKVISRPIPAELGVEGFFFRHAKHLVYWRRLPDGDIGIVTILHEKMHPIERFKEDFGD